MQSSCSSRRRRSRPWPQRARQGSARGRALGVRSAVERRSGRAALAGDRQGEAEGAPLAGRALSPDAPAVLLDDPFADRQPDAGAGIVLLRVETVEGLEDA